MIDAWVIYNRVIKWAMVFAFLPHRCSATNRIIWWEYCYRGRVFITGPGEPVDYYVYLSSDSFLVERLAGRIK